MSQKSALRALLTALLVTESAAENLVSERERWCVPPGTLRLPRSQKDVEPRGYGTHDVDSGSDYQVSAAPRCRMAEMVPETRARTALAAASEMSAARTMYSVPPMVTL